MPEIINGEPTEVSDTSAIHIAADEPATSLNTAHRGTDHDYAQISGNDGATDVTAAQLEELSDGSETTLHSHAAAGGTFVDRGDPASADYTSFTHDGTWRDLDMSSEVLAGAKAVLLYAELYSESGESAAAQFRENGNSNSINVVKMQFQVAGVSLFQNIVVACDANRVIEYNIDAGIISVSLTVRGWWT